MVREMKKIERFIFCGKGNLRRFNSLNLLDFCFFFKCFIYIFDFNMFF